jgi:hypothetical protein
MVKDEYIRKVRVFAGKQGGNPSLKSQEEIDALDKQELLKQKRPSSSSSSSSTSLEPKDNTLDKSKKRFCPPTVKEIEGYVLTKGLSVDAEKFHAYYESNGWRVGKNPMRSWKAAITTWQKNNFDNGSEKKKGETRYEQLRRFAGLSNSGREGRVYASGAGSSGGDNGQKIRPEPPTIVDGEVVEVSEMEVVGTGNKLHGENDE